MDRRGKGVAHPPLDPPVLRDTASFVAFRLNMQYQLGSHTLLIVT